LYHLVVLLEASSLPLADVMRELEKRVGVGGLNEKAERKPV
jgi:phosphoribosyl-ATP pyrophosphohydrolase